MRLYGKGRYDLLQDRKQEMTNIGLRLFGGLSCIAAAVWLLSHGFSLDSHTVAMTLATVTIAGILIDRLALWIDPHAQQPPWQSNNDDDDSESR